jgi:hypothetical protein
MTYDSKEKRMTGRQVDRATNGVAKVRKLYSAQKKTFSIVHQGLTSAEKTTLEAFFTANELVTFTFVWAGDSVTYTCLFSDDIEYAPSPGLRWNATVMMVQV